MDGVYETGNGSPTMEQRIVDALQARWQRATTPAATKESAVPTAQHPEATAAQPPATPEAT